MSRLVVRAAGSAAAALALLAHAEAPPGAPAASAEGALDRGEPRVIASLLVHRDDRGSREARVGVRLEMDPGWHVYWRNPGGSGLPTEVRFRLEGARIGALNWPAPSRFFEPEAQVTTYGYEEPVLLFSRVELDGHAARQRLLHAEVDLLACHDRCIPAHFELTRALEVPLSAEESERARRLFAEAASRTPGSPESLGLELTAEGAPGEDGTLRATLLARGAPAEARAEFFPDPARGLALEPGSARTLEDGRGIGLELAGTAPASGPLRLAGVLALELPDGTRRAVEISLPIRPGESARGIPAAGSTAGRSTGVARVLALALLGGVLLNLMPCVLPVLAIKVFSLVELAHAQRAEALRHALAYTAGIQLSLLALAIVVMGLRIAGAQVGWGFQFQEPLFVFGLALLVVVFGLNLLGVFEINAQGGRLAELGGQATGVRRSFFDGFLAVALATPCTAPFLGTAVGFALAGSPSTIPAVFAAIGAGLALPFVAIALSPGLARLLPRPGRWMLMLRELLGFTLLATAVWLLFVLGRAQGMQALVLALALLWGASLACWAYGRAQQAGRPRLAHTLAALALATVALGSAGLRGQLPGPAAGEASSGWRPWDPGAIREELAQGRSVFVDFTADWCLTCAANERLVLGRPDVEQAFARQQVALFKADWTRRDEAIGAELARFGRAGVPLYLVYHPSTKETPVVLPELLTPDLVLRALEQDGAPPAPHVTRLTSPGVDDR